jgi:hypothetical protein
VLRRPVTVGFNQSLLFAGKPKDDSDVIASPPVLGVSACHRSVSAPYSSPEGYSWFCSMIAGRKCFLWLNL